MRIQTGSVTRKKMSLWSLVKRDWLLLAIIAIPVIYYLLYRYAPMIGIVMAFQKVPRRGSFFSVFSNPWIGFDNFQRFFESPYLVRLVSNTFLLSLFGIVWSFPIPIVFAIMLNEIRRIRYQRVIQTISYMPYFISLVVAVGIVVNFLNPQDGVVNLMLNKLGITSIDFLHDPKYFRTIFIGSGIWQSYGYNAIIYIAAITSIDPQLYEAAKIDGASRIQQIKYITFPSMVPTIVILLILSLGNLLNVGFEKVLLLYSPATYSTADVISTYVYRTGIVETNFGFGTAVGLFNSVINFAFIIVFNKIARSTSGMSLW
jgi:putative aldouronate transport system permease protein